MLRNNVVQEMIARTAKHAINERLRTTMKELKLALQRPYISVVVNYLNLLLGQSAESTSYWNRQLKAEITRGFPQGLSKYDNDLSC
jgi:hypothetical protein